MLFGIRIPGTEERYLVVFGCQGFMFRRVPVEFLLRFSSRGADAPACEGEDGSEAVEPHRARE